MVKEIQKITLPNYRRIYTDLIVKEHPEKMNLCESILGKSELIAIDVINLNKIIFGSSDSENQKHKSYDEKTILYILKYQKRNRLNNGEVAAYFNLSRNTISKWKLIFKHKI